MRDQPTDQFHDFEDVRGYRLDGDGERELLARQTECTFIWTDPDGHPTGVVMNFLHRDGRFWLTATRRRPRIAAIRRDPRVSVAISSAGSGIRPSRSLTYRGHCVVHDDAATLDWFVPEFARAMRPGDPAAAASFAAHLRSPGRVVIELIPQRRIGFDAARMWAAAPSAAPAGTARS